MDLGKTAMSIEERITVLESIVADQRRRISELEKLLGVRDEIPQYGTAAADGFHVTHESE